MSSGLGKRKYCRIGDRSYVQLRLPIPTAPVRAFKIASEAMQQTLLVGDHVLVKPMQAHNTPLRWHDIIVFRHPWDETRSFLKRIVALPGEQVEIRQGQVLVTGSVPA